MRRIAILALVLAGCGSAPQHAARRQTPPWSLQTTLTANADGCCDLTLAEAGDVVLSGATSGVCSIGFAAFAPQSPPPRRALKTELWAGPFTAGGRMSAVLYGGRCHGPGYQLVDLAPDGAAGARERVPTRGYVYPMEAAVAADGTLALAWVERHRIRAALRPLNGRLGAPVTLARASGVDGLAIAFGPGRRLVAAFAQERRVSVASGGAVQVVGPAIGHAEPALAVARNGRAIVAWSSEDIGEEQNVRTRFYAAIREPGRARFARARRIDVDTGIDEFDPSYPVPLLSVAPDGRALLVWKGFRARHARVRYADARAGHGFGAPRTLAAGDVGGAALGAGGAAVVTWVTGDWESGGEVHAAVRAGVFGPEETVGTGERVRGLDARFGPGGRPQVSWIDGPYDGLPVLHRALR